MPPLDVSTPIPERGLLSVPNLSSALNNSTACSNVREVFSYYCNYLFFDAFEVFLGSVKYPDSSIHVAIIHD